MPTLYGCLSKKSVVVNPPQPLLLLIFRTHARRHLWEDLESIFGASRQIIHNGTANSKTKAVSATLLVVGSYDDGQLKGQFLSIGFDRLSKNAFIQKKSYIVVTSVVCLLVLIFVRKRKLLRRLVKILLTKNFEQKWRFFVRDKS